MTIIELNADFFINNNLYIPSHHAPAKVVEYNGNFIFKSVPGGYNTLQGFEPNKVTDDPGDNPLQNGWEFVSHAPIFRIITENGAKDLWPLFGTNMAVIED